MLLLTALALTLVIVSGPVLLSQAQMNNNLPPDFQYYSPEQQQQFAQGVQTQQSAIFIYVFPALGKLAGLWIGWFLLGSVLHLTLTLSGSRSTNRSALNLTAWASLPFALRYLVQIIAILATRQLITQPGLSGFVAADAGRSIALLGALLTFVDIYLIWQIVLLLIGVTPLSGLTRAKAWSAAMISVLILLLLSALPGFIGAQVSNLAGGLTGGANWFLI